MFPAPLHHLCVRVIADDPNAQKEIFYGTKHPSRKQYQKPEYALASFPREAVYTGLKYLEYIPVELPANWSPTVASV